MKAFINKIKRSNKVFLILYLLTLGTYIVSYVFFTINLLRLSTIETPIRIVVLILFGIWLLFWLFKGLMCLFQKKYKSIIILMLFTIIFSGAFCFANYYIGKIYDSISGMSKDKLMYSAKLITLKDKEFNKSSKIGMINDQNDVEGYTLGNKLVKNNSLTNKIERYDDYFLMLSDLYNDKIEAAIVSGNYGVKFSSEDMFANIEKETKVVHEYSEEMKNADNVSYTNKKLTEPFSILIMGVDSTIDGLNPNQAFNGDTLMLFTFNPNTLTASVFSVPRDTYVPISCRRGAWAKINSSAASGTNCVIQTMHDLTGIDIDFYVKINFKGVVDLVNALGGITVDVEAPYFRFNNGIDYHGQMCEQNSSREFGNHMVCLDPGVQKLNGEQALAYSRNRHQYLGSDLDRIKHQQQVISSIANELKNLNSFEQFEEILNAVQKNMDTNMKNEQILSIYDVAKKIIINSLNGEGDVVSINKSFLETYSLPVWTGYSNTSALGYYKGSLDEITNMMKVNLGIEKAKLTKTYEIDYNEDYTSRLYGEKIYTGPVEHTMKLLIGMSKEEATKWCESNGLSVTIKYVDEGDENYNDEVLAGHVADQSVHVNSLLNTLSEVTLYINNTTKKSTPVKEDSTKEKESTNDTEEEEEDNNEEKEEEKLPSEIEPTEDNIDNKEVETPSTDESNE